MRFQILRIQPLVACSSRARRCQQPRERLPLSIFSALSLTTENSWIEGGDGADPYTHNNCAPMDVSCQGTAWSAVQNAGAAAGWVYPSTRSEQNWQAAAHAALAVCKPSRDNQMAEALWYGVRVLLYTLSELRIRSIGRCCSDNEVCALYGEPGARANGRKSHPSCIPRGGSNHGHLEQEVREQILC
jgi:hypothetical protein